MTRLVIGCGNQLISDDAIGLNVVRELSKYQLPAGVKIIEAGTPGLSLLDMITGAEKVIIIDAMLSGAEPGTIHRFTDEDLPPAELFPLSAHNWNIASALELGKRVEMDDWPKEIVILGVEIERLDRFRIALSPRVEEAIPVVVEAILKELLVDSC